MNWLVLISTFAAAGVEWVEALTIVLAVGIFKGWRSAIVGTVLALLALAVMVGGFGVVITSSLSLTLARTIVGVFLLLFGLKWLHKAILRSAGFVALHDEAKAFEETRQSLGGISATPTKLDRAGTSTAFSGVFLEGLEVVFIVIALGGLNGLGAASLGALLALVVVVALGFVFRGPLTKVPENALKYAVGIMLTSFGTFFVGEGMGVTWWRDSLSLLLLVAVYGVVSLLFLFLLRRGLGLGTGVAGPWRWVSAVWHETWGLFVGDQSLALVAVAVVLGVALIAGKLTGDRLDAGVLMVLGILAAIGTSVWSAARAKR